MEASLSMTEVLEKVQEVVQEVGGQERGGLVEWAEKLSDKELLEWMRGNMSAAIPRAVADEVIRRFATMKAELLKGK